MKKVIIIGLFGAICLICAKFISAQAQAIEKTSLNPQVMRAIDEADSLNRILTKQITTAYTDTDGEVIRVRKLSEITDTAGLAKNIIRMVELETEAINAIQSLPDYVYVFAKYNYGCTTCGDNGLGEGSFFWPEMTSGEPVWPPVPLWVKNLNSRICAQKQKNNLTLEHHQVRINSLRTISKELVTEVRFDENNTPFLRTTTKTKLADHTPAEIFFIMEVAQSSDITLFFEEKDILSAAQKLTETNLAIFKELASSLKMDVTRYDVP